jgi:hypothetical protein
MDSNLRREARVPKSVPEISPDLKKLATRIADATVAFWNESGFEEYRVSEITAELIEGEAARIAAIPDAHQRATEIGGCLKMCLQMVADSQNLADAICKLAND